MLWYQKSDKNKERQRQINYNWSKSKKGVIFKSFYKQIERSVDKGFSLPTYSKDDLYNRFLSDPLFETIYSEYVKSGYQKMLYPSMDRKDSTKPYTMENIQLMTWAENRRKSDFENRGCRRTELIVMDLDGKEIRRFDYLMQGVKEMGCDNKAVYLCCNGRQKKHHGFTFRYGNVVRGKLVEQH